MGCRQTAMLVLRTRPEMLARLTGARDIANHALILDFQITKQTKRLIDLPGPRRQHFATTKTQSF